MIGGCEAVGICGSGLIDAVAVFLENGWINKRGRIQTDCPFYDEINGSRIIRLTGSVYLTQDDIREVQLAKGAIAAGIWLLAKQLSLPLDQIERVLLAGAYGNYMDIHNACLIGLIPSVLEPKVTAIGNAASEGARIAALNYHEFIRTQTLAKKIEYIELAALPDFRNVFAKNMNFPKHPSE